MLDVVALLGCVGDAVCAFVSFLALCVANLYGVVPRPVASDAIAGCGRGTLMKAILDFALSWAYGALMMVPCFPVACGGRYPYDLDGRGMHVRECSTVMRIYNGYVADASRKRCGSVEVPIPHAVRL